MNFTLIFDLPTKMHHVYTFAFPHDLNSAQKYM